ncbi:MAG: polyribonucleotide nucleotidyltransferase [Gammaproteobacteria bacterium]|nr:polyribonucleotide nucleotidyltransferase [Gammaproteobacteria bacterium]
MSIAREQFELAGQTVVLETGRVARQATGAVMASCGNTVVLCTAVGAPSPRPGQDFFPLTVNYQEKMYAAGKIPGGFFRREGRPTEKETLTSRLIDRPLRPLFPKGFLNEVHVVATVMSADKSVDPDVLSMIGCSAALAISGVPFHGPIGAARVGYDAAKNLYLLNPSLKELERSKLNMVVAGTESAVLMVESEAQELSEDAMLGAVLFAHAEMQVQIDAIKRLVEKAGKPAWEFEPPAPNEALNDALHASVGTELGEAYRVTDKKARLSQVNELRTKAAHDLEESFDAEEISSGFAALEKRIVRERVLKGEPRIDGRTTTDVRDLDIEVGLLPKAHGSALFQRGETQAIVVTTLGPEKDSALIEGLSGTTYDKFMLHYNFPPYSVGEAGMMGAPKRREIGHGRLARRAIEPMLPDLADSPYTVRVVSEITESNGSSSMASVCGTSLSLMDAGIPIRAAVAGVAMGLVLEGDQAAILTDILGDEDHLGDMDFKVAGTKDGVTALQMDIKIEGITESIMEQALNQARDARLHILGHMNAVIAEARPEPPESAPATETLSIAPDKVRDVIGKGGAVIKSIQSDTNSVVDLKDDGTVTIFADTRPEMEAAKARIEEIVADAEVGQIYNGAIRRLEDYGAFVNILPGKDGLLHVSQISYERVNNIRDWLKMNQSVRVKVTEIDNRGRVSLTMKGVEQDEAEDVPEDASFG